MFHTHDWQVIQQPEDGYLWVYRCVECRLVVDAAARIRMDTLEEIARAVAEAGSTPLPAPVVEKATIVLTEASRVRQVLRHGRWVRIDAYGNPLPPPIPS